MSTRRNASLINGAKRMPEEMVKIKVLAGTVASGVDLAVGKVYEVAESDARYLVGMGKAELHEPRKPRPSELKKAREVTDE
jgi:hypothetical protein